MSSTFLKPGVQVVPCPAKEPHATEDGGQVTGGTAVYSIVVIRRRVEGRKTELYCSYFLLDQNLLTDPSISAGGGARFPYDRRRKTRL